MSTYVLIAGSDNGDDSSSEDGFDSAVDGCRERSSQRHVHNSFASKALLLDILHYELHALENTRVTTSTVGTENLDCHERDLLSDSKSSAADSTGDVATMAVLVIILLELTSLSSLAIPR